MMVPFTYTEDFKVLRYSSGHYLFQTMEGVDFMILYPPTKDNYFRFNCYVTTEESREMHSTYRYLKYVSWMRTILPSIRAVKDAESFSLSDADVVMLKMLAVESL